MPLPSVAKYGAKQCHARCKATKAQCLNPAAYGMDVCRYHGARKRTTVKKGESHPAYRHGGETQEAKAERSASAGRLRTLEELMHLLKMTTARKTPGRKPASDESAIKNS